MILSMRATTPTADDPARETRPATDDDANSATGERRWPRWPFGLALVAAAFNLRPAVSGLGPQLDHVRDTLHMNGATAGVLTALPSLAFAAFGLLAPAAARRLGPVAVVCAGMAAVAVGLTARSAAPDSAVFLLLSAVALAGIAVSNVLMPVVVKRWFPDRVGPATGLYSMALSVGTAVAAAFAVPVTHAVGGSWRPGLAVWAAPALAAALVWAYRLLRQGAAGPAPTASAPGAASTTPAANPVARRITTSRTAWLFAVFFGLQSTAAYAVMGWLPQIFQDSGVSEARSGLLLAVTMFISAPLSFVIPAIAAKRPDQGPIVVGISLCGLAAYAGLAFAPTAATWLWAVLLGLANCAFPTVLTLIGLRSRTGEGVARLSAFAQGVGYLIAVPGPVLVGVLYQHEHGWYAPLALLAVLMVAQAVIGRIVGRPGNVEDELTAAVPAVAEARP